MSEETIVQTAHTDICKLSRMHALAKTDYYHIFIVNLASFLTDLDTLMLTCGFIENRIQRGCCVICESFESTCFEKSRSGWMFFLILTYHQISFYIQFPLNFYFLKLCYQSDFLSIIFVFYLLTYLCSCTCCLNFHVTSLCKSIFCAEWNFQKFDLPHC